MKNFYSLIIIIAFISINAFSQTPNYLLAQSAGGTATDESKVIATDLNGNVYVTGHFMSPNITFGGTTLTNAGGRDIFIVKYDPSGNVVWAISKGGASDDVANGIASDIDGNVIITGYFNSASLTFGSTTLTNVGMSDLFVVKYDAAGNVLWAKSAGGTNSDVGNAITTDTSGYIIVTGAYQSSAITFGSTTLTNAGAANIFIVKYDQGGNLQWARSEGGSLIELSLGIAVDISGNIFLTGYMYSSTFTVGSTTLINSGVIDLFLIKYDTGGNPLWAKSAVGADYDQGSAVSTDGNGNAYITGTFQSSTLSFGSITIANSGNLESFIAKYDGSGNVLWAKAFGGTAAEESYSISTDVNGNSFITGIFQSSVISFSTYTLTNAGAADAFIARYDGSGNEVWAEGVGGTSADYGNSVSLDGSGNIYVSGYFYSPSITFGSTTLTNAGTADIFLAKLEETPLSIKNLQRQEISIAPNPFSESATITLSKTVKNGTMKVFNVLGKEMETRSFVGNTLMINKGDRRGGVYFVQVADGDNIIATKKIVIE